MARTQFNPFPISSPPPRFTSIDDVNKWARSLWDSIKFLQSGKMNTNLRVILANGVTSTVLSDARLTSQSQVIFSPLNAHALALFNAGIYAYTADRHDGQWTIHHTNSVETDMQFLITIIG